jgi:DNA topoisomerase-1
VAPNGGRIRDGTTLHRIKALVIPPAWRDVWISPNAEGHLQATGRDARGRKQYRYHTRWREVRDAAKYAKLALFGHALPPIRQRVEEDLRLPGMPRNRVLATVVRLLDTGMVRVGNHEYRRENHTFGLTTLRNRHVSVSGDTLRFRFRGKGGREQVVGVRDRRLARIVRRCQEIPGQELFQYLDEAGDRRGIDSGDVNEYLGAIGGDEFTAKDFRTWHGSVTAARLLYDLGPAACQTEAARSVAAMVKGVASVLGNTPAVCRKCYIHPAIVTAYLDGTLVPDWDQAMRRNGAAAGLRPEEATFLTVLKRAVSSDPAASSTAGR